MKKVISFDKEILFPTMIGEITAISLDQTLKFLSKNDVEGDFIISGRYKMTEASAIEEDFKYTLPIEITLAETFTLDTTKIEIHDFYYEIVDEEILKVKIDIQVEGVEEVLLEEEIEDVVDQEIQKLEDPKEEEKPQVEEILIEKEPEVETRNDTLAAELNSEEVRECDGEEKSREEKLSDVEPILPVQNEVLEEEVVSDEKIEEKEFEKKVEVQKQDTFAEVEVKETKNTNIQSIFSVFNEAEETYKAYTVYIMRKNDSINSVLDRYQITKEQLEEYNDLSQIELGSKVIIPTTHD